MEGAERLVAMLACAVAARFEEVTEQDAPMERFRTEKRRL